MTDYELFDQRVQKIIDASDDICVSPDFQCDQTGGYPTYLCVSWEQGKAWLELNTSLAEDGEDHVEYEQGCAEFDIRDCEDAEQFNALLEELGEDAMANAYLSEDEEGMMFT